MMDVKGGLRGYGGMVMLTWREILCLCDAG